MSYFHEYTNKRHRKSLRTYSRPFDLRRMKAADWVTAKDGAWDLIDALEASRHYRLATPAQVRALTRHDPFERTLGRVLQYARPKKKPQHGRKKKHGG